MLNRLTVKEFSRYLIFSGAAAAANIGSRYYLSMQGHLNYFISVTIAYIVGMLLNFVLNKNYNFPKGSRHYFHELHSFIVIALIGLVLTNLASGLFLHLLRASVESDPESTETLAHICAVGLIALYSFVGHKYFTFRRGVVLGMKEVIGHFASKGSRQIHNK